MKEYTKLLPVKHQVYTYDEVVELFNKGEVRDIPCLDLE